MKIKVLHIKVSAKQILLYSFATVVLVHFLIYPIYGKHRTFEVIKQKDILKNMHVEIKKNEVFDSPKIPCNYGHLSQNEIVLATDVPRISDLIASHLEWEYQDSVQRHWNGGEGYPRSCTPTISTAIIALYSEEVQVLHTFLYYMHNFLRRQKIHYKIFMVDQGYTSKQLPLFKSTMYNIGALAAMQHGYPCLIFHDIDLLPKIPAHLYACTKNPRLLITKESSRLLHGMARYKTSNAVAITSKEYIMINGMSNKYDSWMEHLYDRLENHDVKMCRLEDSFNQFHSLTLKSIYEWRSRALPKKSETESNADGLMNFQNLEIAAYNQTLSTIIKIREYEDILKYAGVTLQDLVED